METKKIIIGLVQINNGFSGQYYFPYSAGILESYARAHLEYLENYEFLSPIFCRQPIKQAVKHLIGADIIGFSVYVWNEQISLRIAKELKMRSPNTLIVFGGPQIPDCVESFLRMNDFVDIVVHGEGELPFTAILKHFSKRDFSAVPGISYVRHGIFVTHPRQSRINNLDSIPSPYLIGIFDMLIKEHPTHKWIAIWETNRGCPFSCSFCDWGSATTQRIYEWSIERIYQEIEWFAKHKIEYVFTADANFGILKRDEEIIRYCARIKAKTGFPVRLSVQSTKSGNLGSKLTERAFQIQKILSDSGLNQGVVVSMQSLNLETLKSIKRANISTDAFREIQRRFTVAGVETMTDLILGLPEETYDSFVNGVSELIEEGQHNRIQFNNLAILPNAEMGDPEYQRKYGMETVHSRIINIHGFREKSEECIDEYQNLVIATGSMPREDWARTRIFAWASAFLHFDKVFQIPLMITHELTGTSYRRIIERFLDKDILRGYPMIEKIQAFFEAKARDIQSGGEEYCYSKEWLGIWWPADEYIFIELTATKGLAEFYREAEELLVVFFAANGSPEFPNILRDAIKVNQALLKSPFAKGDINLQIHWDILEFRNQILRGENRDLQNGDFIYSINRTREKWVSFNDWCQDVVWYGNKRGAYLYGNEFVKQLSGHY